MSKAQKLKHTYSCYCGYTKGQMAYQNHKFCVMCKSPVRDSTEVQERYRFANPFPVSKNVDVHTLVQDLIKSGKLSGLNVLIESALDNIKMVEDDLLLVDLVEDYIKKHDTKNQTKKLWVIDDGKEVAILRIAIYEILLGSVDDRKKRSKQSFRPKLITVK